MFSLRMAYPLTPRIQCLNWTGEKGEERGKKGDERGEERERVNRVTIRTDCTHIHGVEFMKNTYSMHIHKCHIL